MNASTPSGDAHTLFCDVMLGEYEQLNQQIGELMKSRLDTAKAALKKMLDHFAETREITLIMSRGWTPGFNDGEPCTHTDDIEIGLVRITDAEQLTQDIWDKITEGKEDALTERFLTPAGMHWDDVSEIEDGDINTIFTHKVIQPSGFEYNEIHPDFLAITNQPANHPSSDLLARLANLVCFIDEAEHETNYKVTYILQADGTWSIEYEHYDCGY